jgi:coenzyme F420-reducing hydrogenase alpha subunit
MKRSENMEYVKEKMKIIGELLRTQDNRCTEDPMFCVQVKRRTHWETVAVCFTEKGCKDHLDLNMHNYSHYRDVRIYADSFYRNPEMVAIRQYLMSLEKPKQEIKTEAQRYT